MALEVTPVNRNLHQRVTFMGLEFEDLFVVLGVAALMNVVNSVWASSYRVNCISASPRKKWARPACGSDG